MSYNRGGSYYNPRYGGKKYGAGSNQSGANSHGEAPNSANSAHPNTNTHPPEDRVRDETYFGSSTGGSGYRRDRERERERERDYYGHYRSNSRYEGKYNKYAGGYSNSGPGAKRSTSTYYGTASEAAGNNQASASAAGSSANAGSSYRPHRYDSYGKYADRDKHAERDTVRDKKDRDGSDKEKYTDREKHISPMSGSTSPQDYRGSRRASISRDSRKSSIDGNMDKPSTISTSKFSDGRRGVAVTAGTNNTNNPVNNSRPALSQSKSSIDLKKTEKASKTEQPRPELRSSKSEAKSSISDTNDVKYERRYDERRDDKRYDERRDDKRYDERRDDRRYDDRRSDGYNERRRSRSDDPSDKSADVPEREVKSEKDVPTETDKPERSKAKVTSTMTGSKSMFGKPDVVEKRELHKVDKKEPENGKLDASPKPAETESNEVKPDTKQDKPTDITDPNHLHLFDDDYEVQNDSKKESSPKPIESQLENDEKIQTPVEGDAEPISATSSNSSKLGGNAIQEDSSVPVESAANLQISNSENSENTMNSSNSINSANSDNSVNSANSANSNSASGTENIPSRDSPESDTDSNSDKQNSAKTKSDHKPAPETNSNLSSENKPAVSTTNDQSNTEKEPKKKVTSFSDYLTSKKGKSPETGPETTAIEPVVAAETTDENTQNKPNTAEEDLSDSTTTTQKAAGSTVGSDSTLTPIRDASTDAFDFNNLATIAEDKGKEEPQSAEEDSKSDVGAKSNNENADEIVSEAETIPTDSPPALNRSRRLVRKKDFDEKRHKLKRKLVYSSDEEEHQSKNHKRKHVYFSEDDNDKGYTSDHKSKQGYSSDEKNRHKLGYSSEEEQSEQSGDKNQRKLKPYKLKRDSQGRSLLQRACKKGSLRDIRSYFARGANANEKDFCGFTCLHEAALEGHTDVVKLLLEKGANVNAKADAAGDCETPLIDAAENKHLSCVRALLENGADPSIFNIDGFTALTKIYNQHSNETGYEEIITLLENAAKSYSTKPVRGKSSTVEDPNDTYFADLIKKRGIYKFAAEGFKENTANYFVSGNSLASKPDVLILAARNGHVELVDIILGLNPTPYDIDTESECGVTALLASVGRGHIDIVESLLCKNADPFKTRKQDSLNALEIAQRSAYYSAKECGLIEEFMHKKELSIRMEEVVQQRGEEGSRRKELESERDKKADRSEKREKHDKHERRERQERLERTDRHEKLEKQETVLAKQSDKETLPSDDKDVSGVDADNSLAAESSPAATPSRTPGPSARHSPAPSIPHSSTHSLKHSPAVSDDESKHPTSEVIKKRKQEPKTMSPSPTPLTKAQEELKAKNAEEARAWQEKVEAKKRARRDMFLKSEKEKERRRREEEQQKVDEKNRLAVLHEQERLRLAKEVEEQARVLQSQRRILRNHLRLESFPAGLRNFKMRKQFSVNEALQYTPIYVFDIDGAKYITDLQLTLLLGVANSKINAGTRRQASSLEKSKMWDLFFYMVGIDKSKPVKDVVRLRNEGFAHFKNLMISFVKLDDAAKFVQLEHPDAYSYIWADFAQSSTEVVLESMQPFEPSKRNLFVVEDELQVVVDTKEITSLRFVPPKLRRRKDTLRTISSASKPLW